MNIISKQENITPELAQLYLTTNGVNRKARTSNIRTLSAAIKRGEWQLTHQGIAFSRNGALLDGQHRLMAIIDANIPVQMMVYRNVNEDAFRVMDSGAKRSIADHTGMSQKTAEVCRLIAAYICGGSTFVTADQCIKIYNSGIGELHDELIIYCSTSRAVTASAPIRAAAVLMMISGNNKQIIKDIYSNMVNQQFAKLPPIAQALLRQINLKKVMAQEKTELITKSLKVFNPNNAYMSKLISTPTELENTGNMIRSILGKVM